MTKTNGIRLLDLAAEQADEDIKQWLFGIAAKVNQYESDLPNLIDLAGKQAAIASIRLRDNSVPEEECGLQQDLDFYAALVKRLETANQPFLEESEDGNLVESGNTSCGDYSFGSESSPP